MKPRIAPLPEAEYDESLKRLLGALGVDDGRVPNVFATFARHPALFARWLPFGAKLLQGGELPARERELVILRTAWNCVSDYEWGQHARIAAIAGMTDEEIARIPDGPEAPGWEPFDAALLRAADELHEDARLSEETWTALSARYDERQLIELVMLIGQYHLVAFALNSFGVERDAGVVGLPSRA